ncbi:hypothetical protein KFK09_027400 [Dendrobium nobile]|uniref:Uncharacterized protein n=1 Tax=Dendrobium nobile TaxID=94219 RepID=A0A8T3AAQ4_DENNO|nr:hypothetical protein KFK09_027400 [Dendrobium nobile]
METRHVAHNEDYPFSDRSELLICSLRSEIYIVCDISSRDRERRVWVRDGLLAVRSPSDELSAWAQGTSIAIEAVDSEDLPLRRLVAAGIGWIGAEIVESCGAEEGTRNGEVVPAIVSDGLALLLGNLVVVVFFDRNKGWIKIIDRSERFWGDFRPMSYFARGFVEGRLVFCHEEEESWSTLR